MKEKKSLLALEVILGLTVIVMFCAMNLTFKNPFFLIRFLSGLYTGVAAITMFFIVKKLVNTSDKEDCYDVEDARDDLRTLSYVCHQKGMDRYAQTVQVQLFKFEERTKLLRNMLEENFDADSRSTEIEVIIDKYRRVFYANIEKITKRVEIIDVISINSNLKVNSELKEEARNIYNTHINYIEEKININEKINIELDKLTTELSRINESEGENNLEPLQDYIQALKSLNDNTTDDEMEKLMEKY